MAGVFNYDVHTVPADQLGAKRRLKVLVAKAATVNCRLAKKLFLLMGREYMVADPNSPEVEEATERLGDANGIEIKLKNAGLWSPDPQIRETPEPRPQARRLRGHPGTGGPLYSTPTPSNSSKSDGWLWGSKEE